MNLTLHYYSFIMKDKDNNRIYYLAISEQIENTNFYNITDMIPFSLN